MICILLTAIHHLKKPEDNGVQFDWFYFTEELPGKDKQGYEEIKKKYRKLYTAEVPTTPVMMDNPPHMHRDLLCI